MSRTAALLTLASIAVVSPLSLYAQGYGGPSLLSRGGNSPGKRGRGPVNFQVYAAARGSYETGLIGPTLDETGSLPSLSVSGMQFEAGAYGAKTWRRSSIGLDYRGDYRQTQTPQGLQRSQFSGTNQALSFDWQSQMSRRLTVFARQTAGTTNRAFGGFSAPAFVDQDNFGVPLNEVFDSRVYFSQTSAGVAYRQSARTTIQLTAGAFIVKRSNRALIGMQGYRAGADMMRQWSRSNVGVGYSYIKLEYPRVYGGSQIHMMYAAWDRQLTRNVSIAAQLGIFRADTIGTQRITLSPEIAAILGRTTGVEAFQRITAGPQGTLTANYTLERSRLSVTYSKGVAPGNGVYITSEAESVRGGYSYSGTRRLSLGASAGYTRSSSIGVQLGDFSSAQGGIGLSYRLGRFFGLSLQADQRRFSSPSVTGRTGSSISAGLSFTPSSIPVSIW